MPKQSSQATSEGIKAANDALKVMLLNQTELADRLLVSRKTVSNFFTGKLVSDEIFSKICEALKLDWQEIAGITDSQSPKSGSFETESSGLVPSVLDIEALVQQTRSAIEPLIREQCGTMRVLDMDQPIELTGDRGIYTNVNILEKQSRLRSERELLEDCDFDNRTVRERRLSGLAAVEQHRRLMLLGKPGAGKTTFMKYLAMQCITSGFAANKVPFLVTLKDFAEADDHPSLVDYLSKLIIDAKHSDRPTSKPGTPNPPNALPLLLAGRALILLDGLDEVQTEDTERVIREIRDTADRFRESRFVITCRIAAKEYTFERFTEVEVADFNEQQIATFAENWFQAKNDLPKAKTLVQRLKENEPIQELANSPLLLTLLCLVFGEGGDFPSNRADLYEEGIKILLKKWDAKRNIKRDELYRKLDVQRREDLLSYVALQTFQQKEYFIKRRRIEGYIAKFISNIKSVSTEPESLRIDSEAALHAIQVQHGLLIERARDIYSFSHLTFQEYFTAREIATTNQIGLLAPKIGEKRWREVFLLTVGILRNADELLLSMKSHIDSLTARDAQIQYFLESLNQKSLSVQKIYKPAAVRAFYFNRDYDCNHERDRYLYLALARDCYIVLDRYLGLDTNLDSKLNYILTRSQVIDCALDRAPTHALYLSLICEVKQALKSAESLESNRAHNQNQDFEFKRQLQEISDLLPDTSYQNWENFKNWWKINGQQWTADLRKIMIQYRNIGHDWQFTDDQKTLLQQYYDANRLLIECLNSDCYVSRSVREEIEATLLLPMEEIDKLRMQN
jgi:predicted NACHT family NTPase